MEAVVERQFRPRPDNPAAEEENTATDYSRNQVGIAAMIHQLRAARPASRIHAPSIIQFEDQQAMGAPRRQNSSKTPEGLAYANLFPGILDNHPASRYSFGREQAHPLNGGPPDSQLESCVTRIDDGKGLGSLLHDFR